jgi:hypothetical protein
VTRWSSPNEVGHGHEVESRATETARKNRERPQSRQLIETQAKAKVCEPGLQQLPWGPLFRKPLYRGSRLLCLMILLPFRGIYSFNSEF